MNKFGKILSTIFLVNLFSFSFDFLLINIFSKLTNFQEYFAKINLSWFKKTYVTYFKDLISETLIKNTLVKEMICFWAGVKE